MSQPYQLPMFFSEVPPVKAGQVLETAKEKMTLEISGLICCDWYSSQGRDVSLLKMCVEELAKDISTLFVANWKLRVTKHKHSYILLRWSVRRTSESAFSLWPTPTATDQGDRSPSKTPVLTKNGTWRHLNKAGEQSYLRLDQTVKMYSTPNARDFTNPSKPTDGRIQRKIRQGWSMDLNDQVQFDSPFGYANPDWWEAMMGLPSGWTALPKTFPASQITWAYRNMLMSRLAPSPRKSRTTKTVSQRRVMRLCGGKRIR